MVVKLKSFLGKIIPKSLIGRLTVVNLGVILLMTAAMVVYIDHAVAGHLLVEHKQKCRVFLENLAANVPDFILAEDYAGLQRLVTHALASDSDLRYAYVVDPAHDKILAHTFAGGFPADLKNALKNKFTCRVGKQGSKMLITEDGELLDIYSPVLGGKAGCVHIGMSMRAIDKDAADMKMELLAVAGGLAILTLLISLVYSRKLGRTMDVLTEGADNIGAGNLEHRIILADKSEIGILGRTINQMAAALQDNLRQRQRDSETLAKMKKLESIGELAGGLAHDYNNLHTAVLGNIDLAKTETDKESRAYDFLCRAEEALVKETRLTRQLLTFSHGGAPNRRVVNIKDFLSSTCPLYLSGSNCKLDINVSESLPPISIDPDQISQVMQNLLQNACEAMPTGGKITLSAREVVLDDQTSLPLPADRYLKISFADEGYGIDKVIADRIFDPYFSTEERGARKGQGLGLSICRAVILKHGGWINYEINPAGGATFAFYLSIEQKPAAPQQGDTKIAPASSPRSSRKILVMDDEQVVREVTRMMLINLGCQVMLAKDGREAIKIFRKEKEAGRPFAAVILDLVVTGGMGGKETAKELLKITPETSIIVASGYSDDPVMTEYAGYGFKRSLTKPYQLNELRRTLAALGVGVQGGA